MRCINKVYFKNELKEYTEALGSEAAAYYLIGANDSHKVEETPDGQPSKLWEDILAANKGDRKAAIREKAKYYTQSYLNKDNWINKEVIEEPAYVGSPSTPGNTAVQDILQNDVYDRTKKGLAMNGIEDDSYAMKTAIHETRNAYMDQQQAIFQNEYVKDQASRKKIMDDAKGFFAKVIAFFKSGFFHGEIKDPTGKQQENARKLAYVEFNETLYYLNMVSMIEILKNYTDKNGNVNIQNRYRKIGEVLESLYGQGDRISINDVMSYIEQADKDIHVVFNNNQDIFRALHVLELFDAPLLEQGMKLFTTKDDIINAFNTKDKGDYSKEQLDYVNSFIVEFEKWLKDNLQEDVLTDLKTMYFEHDESKRCSNEQAYVDIISGLKSRLVSIKRSKGGTDKTVVYNIKAKIQDYESKNMYDVADIYKIFIDVLDGAQTELREAARFFEDCRISGKNINANRLMYFKRDVLGYYQYIISKYIATVSQESGLSEEQRKDILDKLNNTVIPVLNDAKKQFNSALFSYTKNVVDGYVTDNMDLGSKAAFMRYAEASLQNQINNGEVMWSENFVGDPNSSQSVIVRMIANMLNNDERHAHRQTVDRGKRLMRLYKNCEGSLSRLGADPTNYLKNFVELDDDGVPTGNFLRSVNYGQFAKDLAEFEKKLRAKYYLPVDQLGNTVWNWNVKGTEKDYNDYHDELDDWLEQHCERKYTAEYYKTRRRYITYKVRQALNPINQQISNLYEKCTQTFPDGSSYVMINKLTPDERTLLESLLQQKAELGNPYSIQYDSTGKKILKLRKKDGDALTIAENIMAWNKLSSKYIKRLDSREKFDNALAHIKNEDDKTLFKNTFLKKMVSPEFYDMLSKCFTGPSQTNDYLKACAERNKILAATKDDGEFEPNLLKLNDEAWYELKRLEEERARTKTKQSKADGIEFDDIAQRKWITMQDPENAHSRITVLSYLERQAKKDMLTNPTAMDEFYNKYYYRTKDSKGREVLAPLPVFYYVAPKSDQYYSELTVGPYIEYEKSGWLNENYDDNNEEIFQPKASMYKNEKFFDITKDGSDTKKLYDEFISVMQEAISYLPADVKMSKYRMPQITDDTSSLIARNLGHGNVKGAVGSVSQNFTITENDVDIYREDRALRPDRSVVETVPIRYIKDLRNPAEISCDILKTVMQFYEMSINFDRKSKTVPIVESLIEQMSSEGNTEQVTRAKTELEMYGYGRMQKGFGDAAKKMTTFQKAATKGFNNFRSIANVALLAGNIYSATKGLVSALWQTLWWANVGKYYAQDDALYAAKLMFHDLPAAIASIGSSDTSSLLQAAMQYNGVSSSVEEIFGRKNKSRFRRVFCDNFKMGPFTFGDYSTGAFITGAVYHATRLVEMPNSKGEYKLVTRSQCIDMFKKAGKTGKEAKEAFKQASDRHLLSMYELDEDGRFVLKEKVTFKIKDKDVTIRPKFYVNEKILNRISGTIEQRVAVANGVISKHGKGKVYQGTLSRYVVVMRGFMIQQGYDRLKSGNDFDERYYDKGEVRSMGGNDDYLGQYNFETGEVEAGTLRSFLKTFPNICSIIQDLLITLKVVKRQDKQKPLTRNEWQGVMQTIGDLAGFFLFWGLVTFALSPLAKKYPENWWWAFLRLVAAGAMIETATMINPMTALDLITTVTTAESFLEDLLSFFSASAEVIGLSDKDVNEYVQHGSPYTGKPRWFKYLMKMALRPTGITGYYETFAPTIPGLDNPKSKEMKQVGTYDNFWDYITAKGMNSKYNYYQRSVFPGTLLPSSKSESQEGTKNNIEYIE